MGGIVSGVENLFTGGGDGASQQANAAAGANAQIASEFNTVNQNAQPYVQAGASAVNQLSNQMSALNTPFSAAQFQQSPGYQFSLQQGQQAIQNSSAAQGGLVSGAQMAALNNYSQNTANNEYQQAFNNYQTQTTNSYNRLAGLANIGQQANAGVGGMGMNAANQMGQNSIGASNAYAAQQQSNNSMVGSLAGLGAVALLA